MEASKDFLKQKGYSVEKVFRVPSRSEEGEFHIVKLLGNNTLGCDCIAGSMKRVCYHQRKIAERLEKVGVFIKL